MEVTPYIDIDLSRTDKITILEVEAVELVAGLLRIHYVLIDHEGRSLGAAGDTLTNLAAENIVSNRLTLAAVSKHRRNIEIGLHTGWVRIFQIGRKAPLELRCSYIHHCQFGGSISGFGRSEQVTSNS